MYRSHRRGVALNRSASRLFLLLALAGCALRPDWHWEKPGADAARYRVELNRCKGSSYARNDGLVTQEDVRRMHACMEAQGWHKVPDSP